MTASKVSPPVWSIADCDYRLRVVRRRLRFWASFATAGAYDFGPERELIDQLLEQRFDLAMAEAAELAYTWSESAGPALPAWPVTS